MLPPLLPQRFTRQATVGISVSDKKDKLPVVSEKSGDLALYIRDVKKYAVLSREDEQELARLWHDERDPEAFRKLVLANLRFVVKIANEYRRYGFRMQDLTQEGNIGLMKAVVKFNPYRGYRLISYAVWWIRAQIHDYILSNWSMVKLGTTQLQRKLFYKLQNAQSVLKDRLQDEATDTERDQLAMETIADVLGTDPTTVKEFRGRMQRRDLSLEAPVSGDGDMTIQDIVPYSGEDQEDGLGVHEAMDTLQGVITEVRKNLGDRDLDILDSRILSDSPETLDAIGGRYGISKERVRQLEKRIRERIVSEGRKHFTETKLLAPPSD